MKNKFIWLGLSFFLVAAMLLASCGKSTTTTPTSTTTTTKTTTTTTKTTTTTTPPTSVTTTTTATGNWWDSLGTPQYGSQVILRVPRNISAFDPQDTQVDICIENGWYEKLFTDDWTLDPSVFNYQIAFRPNDYVKGYLATTWEFTDVDTFVVHLRQNVYWQNIPPVNGRQFTSADVVYHYNRQLGLGGFPPNVGKNPVGALQKLTSVTADGKYTVVFKFTGISSTELILEAMESQAGNAHDIEAQEAVKQWGNLDDWHHAIGTGPFILQDYVENSSAILVRNPNYWGYDERYPQNPLPYVDSLKYLLISNDSTALAAFRTGKLSILDSVSTQNAQEMKTSHPEVTQIGIAAAAAVSLDPRNDTAPFNDKRVRQALQMAIDLPTIAETYYGGTCPPYPSTLTSQYMTGWGFPYTQWPQDLKDQYAFNVPQAKALLAAAGYPTGFNTDIVVEDGADLDLLQIVKSEFAAINVIMTIQTMDPGSWSSYVWANKKFDALAEKSVGILGLGFEPTSNLVFYWSVMPNYSEVHDPVYDAFATALNTATTTDEIKKIVRDANEYAARQHFSISLLQPNIVSLVQPWLKGYSGQDQANYAYAGPFLNGFYMSRFWLVQ